MVNIRAKKQALENALIGQDALRVANVFELPLIVPADSSNLPEPCKHNLQSLYVGDNDYGGVLTSLLDATAAAEAVRKFCSVYFLDYRSIELYSHFSISICKYTLDPPFFLFLFFFFTPTREMQKRHLKLRHAFIPHLIDYSVRLKVTG